MVSGSRTILPHWSGDGASLYFYRLHPMKSFRKIPVEGGTSSEVAALDFLRETSARVDAQGRAVVYTIEDKRRPMSTLVRDLDSGKEHTLGRTINNPRWSPDSRTVFGWYTAPDPEGDIWNVAACPVDGGPAPRRERICAYSIRRRIPPFLHPGHRCGPEHARTVDGVRRWHEFAKGRNPRPAAARVGLRRIADGPNRFQQVECKPARALGGAAEEVKRSRPRPDASARDCRICPTAGRYATPCRAGFYGFTRRVETPL